MKKNNIAAYHKSPRILYFCPDMSAKSGGVRRLYRHVEMLVRNGFPAAILHQKKDFVLQDQPQVPVHYLETHGILRANDIVVIPEGFPGVMHKLRDLPIRRFVIALSWSYIFATLPDTMDWRAFNIERVLLVCPFIRELVAWSMGLPTHLLDFGINPDLYYYQPEAKKLKISWIHHKARDLDAFRRLLRARSHDYVDKIEWKALCDLSEAEYAAQIRESSVFLNLSPAEGLLTSCLEAMLAGCIVVGFNSVGGQNTLIGEGQNQNSILAQNGDYVSLAYKIEPLLKDLLRGRADNWESVIQNGIHLSSPHTPESEETSVIEFWRKTLMLNKSVIEDPTVIARVEHFPNAGIRSRNSIAPLTSLSPYHQHRVNKHINYIDALFNHWFEKICIPDILEEAKRTPLEWQDMPLAWEVGHEILAFHCFCKGKYSLDELIRLSNNRFRLLDSIWPGPLPTREELDRFYFKSAGILPWGHGVFQADHNIEARRSDWLRRVELLLMLKKIGVNTIVDYGAGGGHTSLIAKALGFHRIIHHEYKIFHPYVLWRAGFIDNKPETNMGCQFIATDASWPLSVAEPVQAVICNDVAEHVHDPESMLEEIRHALEKGGYLIWVSVFGEGISCHLHSHLRGKEEDLLARHGFSRISELPVKYEGHSGLYQMNDHSLGKTWCFAAPEKSKALKGHRANPSPRNTDQKNPIENDLRTYPFHSHADAGKNSSQNNASDPLFTKVTDLYLASADQMDRVLGNLSQLQATGLQQVDAYATVIGGLSGLNYLQKIEPAEIIFFDLNEAALTYARLILEIIHIASDPKDFISRIFGHSVNEFLNETGHSDLTFDNQDQYLAHPVDKKILTETLNRLSHSGRHTYQAFIMPYLEGKVLDGVRNCRRLIPCYPIDEPVPVGGGKSSEYDRSGNLVPNTNTFFYGYGWLFSSRTFQRTKHIIHKAKIRFARIDLLNQDLGGLLSLSGSNVIHVSNLDDWFPANWKRMINVWHSKIAQAQGRLLILTSHNGIFRLRIDPHQYAYAALAPYVFGNVVEVTHRIPWGFHKIKRINVTVDDFLSGKYRSDTIILHILVGEGICVQTFTQVLCRAMENGRRLIVLEHNKESKDWTDQNSRHFFTATELRSLLEKKASEHSWNLTLMKKIAGEKDQQRNLLFVLDADPKLNLKNKTGGVY